MRRRPGPRLRQQVWERARGCCEYCRSQESLSTETYHVDHIIPTAAGGTTTLDNLALACFGCNSRKQDRTAGPDPHTGRRVDLFHPRRQQWSRHFNWSEDHTQIRARTAVGRATVELLDLNRPAMVRLRGYWVTLGFHPPSSPQRTREGE